MVWRLFEYTATVIEYIIYSDFMIRFLNVKNGKNKVLCFTIILLLNTILTLTFNHFMNYEGALCVIRIIMNFSISVLILNGSMFEKLLSAIILDISALIASYVSLTFIGFLSSNTIEQLIEMRGFIRLFVIFIAKVILFEVTRMILHIKGKKNFSFDLAETIIISVIFATTLMIALGIFRVDINAGVPTDSPVSVLIGLGLIFINVLIYILMKKISDKNREKEKLLLDTVQNKHYFSQFKEFEKQFNEMRKIRHDMKNHLQCLSAFISENDMTKAQKYIDDIIENKLDFGTRIIKTGNKIVDTVINMKLIQCKKDGINTIVHINKFDTYLEDTDMCALLSNLLDNAIEASNKEEQKEIQIEIMPRKGYVNIIIKNAISESVLENNPELMTTRQDNKTHGIGIKSVSDTVKKYEGMLEFYENNNFFIADVWLPLKVTKNVENCKLGK